jgi:hypothetical protein
MVGVVIFKVAPKAWEAINSETQIIILTPEAE